MATASPLVNAQASAAAPPSVGIGRLPPPTATPLGAVRVGVYLYAIQELDFSRQTFHPRMEIWWRWRGEAFDPLATLHIVGATSTHVVQEDRRKLPDGEDYLVARVDAVISQPFDTGAFPFDRHRLLIQLESPYEDDHLQYSVDADSSQLDPAAFSPGWRLSGFRLHEERIRYPTDFGLGERTNDQFSRVVVEVVAERVGWRIAIDHFIGFIVCVLLCLLGYLINPALLSVRTSLVTAATFTAVGNKYIVNTLTETSVTARLANVAIITSFAMVLLFMITSITCERLIEGGNKERALQVNRNVGISAALAYVVIMVVYFWRTVTAAPT